MASLSVGSLCRSSPVLLVEKVFGLVDLSGQIWGPTCTKHTQLGFLDRSLNTNILR